MSEGKEGYTREVSVEQNCVESSVFLPLLLKEMEKVSVEQNCVESLLPPSVLFP